MCVLLTPKTEVFPLGTSAFLSTLSTSVLELLAFFAASSNECIGKDISDLDPSESEARSGDFISELVRVWFLKLELRVIETGSLYLELL